MGCFDFYIELKIELNDANILLQEFKSNDLYKEAFHYGIFVEWLNSEFNAGISSKIDNFLPANTLIFRFLSLLKETNKSFKMKTYEVERNFDFANKAEFINFMYSTWEKKIDSAYEKGTILISSHKYYKVRDKLYKKYYKKL